MATKIILKKNSTAGSQPTTLDLDVGEVAVNLADRKLYTKTASNAIIVLGSLYVSGTAPSSPVEGDPWYDTGVNKLKTYNGSDWDVVGGELIDFGVTATATELNTLDGVTATTAELNYLDGVTSSVQTQLDGKAASGHNHSLDSLSNVNITSNSSGELLVWAGSEWVNRTLAEAGVAAASHTHTAAAITDFDTEVSNNPAVAANTAKVSNATHTGEVTGSTALTIANDVVTAPKLAVTGNGTTSQFLRSDGDGTFSWAEPGNTVYTAGTGVDITSDVISIGQDVATTADVTFNSVNVGDLTVTGTLNAVSSNEVNIGDSIVVLNADEAGAPSTNAGIEIERGTSTNVQFLWNEADDAWDLGDETLQNVTLDGGSY